MNALARRTRLRMLIFQLLLGRAPSVRHLRALLRE
jgi:hypothetical protein